MHKTVLGFAAARNPVAEKTARSEIRDVPFRQPGWNSTTA
jgi:hypothetical protein